MSRRDFRLGDWIVQPSLAKVQRGGEEVHVTPRAMAVLVCLAQARGEVVSRNDILDAVWPGMSVTQDALSQCIVELRKAFRDNSKTPSVIETIPKVGVRLILPIAAADVSETGAAQTSSATSESNSERNAVDAAMRHQSPDAAAGARHSASWRGATPALLIVVVVVGGVAFWLGERSFTFTTDPLRTYEFSRLTEFGGAEEHAAISRDGRFVAFLSDHGGAWDVWAGQIGTGDFRNLTEGTVRELRNTAVRTVGFTPDGSRVMLWTKTTDPSDGGVVDAGWAVPTVGGVLEPYHTGIAELDWSPDGERIVYHTAATGDPLFVTDAGQRSPQQIYVAAPGIHCHFPLWSRDGQFIYFVQGLVPDDMDVWRIRLGSDTPERITFHNSRVSFPTFLNDGTLLYLATAEDGSGPWLHAVDLRRRASHRINTGGQEYASVSASADGRRLVGTAARSMSSLWRVPLGDREAGTAAAAQIDLPTPRGSSPRIAPGFILYRAPKAGVDGLWKLADGAAVELTSGLEGRVVAGAALAPDGRRVALPVRARGLTQLHVMNIDGGDVRRITEGIDLRGAPDWSPDGDWIAFTAMQDREPRLFKIPAGGGPPVALGKEYAVDPVWSPTGRFLVYSGRDVGTSVPVKAINADGSAHALPSLVLSRGARRMDFLDENRLVVLKGNLSHKELWVVDLRSGDERQLTALGAGALIGDFDVSADGGEIVFDRTREASDIMLIELAGS